MALWQKALLGVLLVVGAPFGWKAIRGVFASDEQKIRWVFEDMERGFNGTRMAPVIGGFRDRYVDESSGLSRQELREVLAYLFLREHDPETKRFRLRLEIDEEALAIELGEGRADVRGGAFFFETKAGVEKLFWDARFRAEMDAGDGDWKVLRTYEVNVAEMEDLD